MKIKYKIASIIYLMFAFTFYSCALSDFEHENNLNINLSENEYSVEYIQFLDSDLIPFFYPEKINSWEIIKQPNEAKFHLRKYLNFSEVLSSPFRINETSLDSISDKEIFSSLINKEIIMKKPITVSSSNYFVMRNFYVEGAFSARNIPAALDPFINDEEEDIDKLEDIVNQLIGFLYKETIENSDIEFNQKHIYRNSVENYSKYVGSKTDIWFNGANQNLKRQKVIPNKVVVFIPQEILCRKKEKIHDRISRRLHIEKDNYLLIPIETMEIFEKITGGKRLTTGTASILWAVENFEKVIIHGFDFFIDSKAHYNENFMIKWLIDLGINKKGVKHNTVAEKQFIEKLINENQVILLKDYLQQ